MDLVLWLRQLPPDTTESDIREFLSGIEIPEDGIEIRHGSDPEAFVMPSNDLNLLKAVHLDGHYLKGRAIKVFLTKRSGTNWKMDPMEGSGDSHRDLDSNVKETDKDTMHNGKYNEACKSERPGHSDYESHDARQDNRTNWRSPKTGNDIDEREDHKRSSYRPQWDGNNEHARPEESVKGSKNTERRSLSIEPDYPNPFESGNSERENRRSDSVERKDHSASRKSPGRDGRRQAEGSVGAKEWSPRSGNINNRRSSKDRGLVVGSRICASDGVDYHQERTERSALTQRRSRTRSRSIGSTNKQRHRSGSTDQNVYERIEPGIIEKHGYKSSNIDNKGRQRSRPSLDDRLDDIRNKAGPSKRGSSANSFERAQQRSRSRSPNGQRYRSGSEEESDRRGSDSFNRIQNRKRKRYSLDRKSYDSDRSNSSRRKSRRRRSRSHSLDSKRSRKEPRYRSQRSRSSSYERSPRRSRRSKSIDMKRYQSSDSNSDDSRGRRYRKSRKERNNAFSYQSSPIVYMPNPGQPGYLSYSTQQTQAVYSIPPPGTPTASTWNYGQYHSPQTPSQYGGMPVPPPNLPPQNIPQPGSYGAPPVYAPPSVAPPSVAPPSVASYNASVSYNTPPPPVQYNTSHIPGAYGSSQGPGSYNNPPYSRTYSGQSGYGSYACPPVQRHPPPVQNHPRPQATQHYQNKQGYYDSYSGSSRQYSTQSGSHHYTSAQNSRSNSRKQPALPRVRVLESCIVEDGAKLVSQNAKQTNKTPFNVLCKPLTKPLIFIPLSGPPSVSATKPKSSDSEKPLTNHQNHSRNELESSDTAPRTLKLEKGLDLCMERNRFYLGLKNNCEPFSGHTMSAYKVWEQFPEAYGVIFGYSSWTSNLAIVVYINDFARCKASHCDNRTFTLSEKQAHDDLSLIKQDGGPVCVTTTRGQHRLLTIEEELILGIKDAVNETNVGYLQLDHVPPNYVARDLWNQVYLTNVNVAEALLIQKNDEAIEGYVAFVNLQEQESALSKNPSWKVHSKGSLYMYMCSLDSSHFISQTDHGHAE